MADSKSLRFDAFVNAVRSDPSQSEPLIMLAGYVGRSDIDGNVRIYTDASLNHWHEAAEDDYRFSSLLMGVIQSPAFTMNVKTATNVE